MDPPEARPELPAESRFEVLLYIYDLSKELAKSFKKILKGKPLPGIWHTGLVAYGREYYFGSTGIESCRPGETILGEPDQILNLGNTELPFGVFLEYILALGESTYKPETYHLLEHSSNCFSQEACQFLTGRPIPSEIRDLSEEISTNKTLSTALKEYFDKLSLRAEGTRGISFGASGRVVEELRNGHSADPRPPASATKRKKSAASMSSGQQKSSPESEKKKDKSREPKTQPDPAAGASQAAPIDNGIAEAAARPQTDTQVNQEAPPPASSNGATNVLDEDLPGATPRRSRRYDDPPIFFPDVNGPDLLKRLMVMMEGSLSPEENKDLGELMEYLTTDGGAWALGTSHLETVGRFLNDRELPAEVPVLALQVMQAAALKEDVILLLHQDRERHHLMSYFFRIESLSPREQAEVCGLLCNLCSNSSSYDWLTYISEWEEAGRACSNSRVTVRVAVHGLLADAPDTRERGCALVFNLALKKELFDDIATEVAMAVMQFLQNPPAEELLFQSLTALLRFMIISYNEVPALMKMLGPDVDAFRGTSPRIDPLVEDIQTKLRISR